MAHTLLIVESPAKAKTIGRYLGSEYTVAASVGHVRDLPSSTLGVDVNNQYKPRYITMRGKESILRNLREMKENSERVLLATDPDREGEAIAWHLAIALGLDPSENCRVTFHEITEHAIKEAIQHPRPLDMNLVDAQQARRILDRLVGYELSPLLWKKVLKGLSAGRVQSLATRMVVQREREIEAFVPEEYWKLLAKLKKQDGQVFSAQYYGRINGEKVSQRKLPDSASVEELIEKLKDQEFIVENIKKAQSKRASYPPFTTSSLQQEASRYLGYSAQRTMRIAQQLYEGIELNRRGQTSLITYIRTDSMRISTEALSAARSYIAEQYGQEFLPAKPRFFKNKKAAQDAHEAIRPIHFDLSPLKIKDELQPEQFRLYQLIWDKFIASQMNDVLYEVITLDVRGDDEVFRAKGERVIFPGWQRQYQRVDKDAPANEDDERMPIPELEKGEVLKLQKLLPEQKFTQPPARYSEATLIKAMEEEGVGRPSTYAPTLATIQQRNYVLKEGRSLMPGELGVTVTELLESHFPEIVNTEFTAHMEDKLDEVEEGKLAWQDLLGDFYPPFHEQVLSANEKIEKRVLQDEPTGESCPECHEGELVIKHGRYGKFIACNHYPDCKYTRNIEELAGARCPLCGSELLIKRTHKRRNSIFYVCDKKGSEPNCPFISWDLPLEEKCPQCGAYMLEKTYRKRKYKYCSNPDCVSHAKKKSRSKTAETKTGKK